LQLINFISKYIEENPIEEEVTVSNRKELYQHIYEIEKENEQQKKVPEEQNWKLWTIKDLWSHEQIQTISQNESSINLEEGEDLYQLDSVIEDGSFREKTGKFNTESSDPGFLNYSINNLVSLSKLKIQ